MRIKLFLSFRWIVSCGTPVGGCAGHRPPPLLNQKSSLWCSATHLSHCESVSPPPANAPHGREPETVSGSAPSPPASVPCHVVFFRLAGPPHARLVPLEATVLEQGGLTRVADALALGHLLVVRLACIGAAQVADPLAVGIDNDDVLVTVGFLLAAVVQPLFFWVFRALAPPLGAVDDQLRRLALLPLVLREPLGVAFGEAAQALQGAHQDGQQPVDPTVNLGLAQVEEAAQQLLQWIGLLGEEDE